MAPSDTSYAAPSETSHAALYEASHTALYDTSSATAQFTLCEALFAALLASHTALQAELGVRNGKEMLCQASRAAVVPALYEALSASRCPPGH